MTSITTKIPNINDLLADGAHFVEQRGADHYIINSLTGLVVMVIPIRASKVPLKYTEHRHSTGEVYWTYEQATEIETVSHRNTYNPAIIDIICSRMVEGRSLSDICGKPDMPTYATLCRWRRQHPWITEALEQARRDRAEVLRDEALSEAMAADEDNVTAQRLKTDLLKWAASVDDPARYSPKTKVDATLAVATQIVVDTGISRVRDEERTVVDSDSAIEKQG